jgi:type II restriction/modification system DNA methylase subunit YeeA
METTKLKKFAQFARRSLLEQVSAKLKLVLAEDSLARRESPEAVAKLEERIREKSGQWPVASSEKEKPLAPENGLLIAEEVAYTWFNRFCALRFMDVHRYNRVNIVSPADPGQFQPEILAEAKMGHIDEEMVSEKVRQQIFALLNGKAPSRDPQGEAYRLLVVAACNYWNKAMPFLFQRIDDYTELLMPDDLFSGNSILAYIREAMTPDTCEDVEVIGWLYQFYISEKKDEVFDGLKKNKKITPENIPAATQLFTPHWIVRYLVENSLGRLWLLNRPGSKLAGQMDYYIKPEQAETDYLRISKPEEIKICDPACGSGHMLTYAFDLLYAIYEEEGYEPAEIPEKILTNNLYGIEIDERAGELAAFALTMKALQYDKRFFRRSAARGELVEPNICVLENVHFDGNELKDYMDYVGRDLFTAPLLTTLHQFEEADNFGSLIRPEVTDVDGMIRILKSKNVDGQLFISMTHQKVLQALRQADTLSPRYHVVIANPPYMGTKGMNGGLKNFAQRNYSDSKVDLFSMFIERIMSMVMEGGMSGYMTPFSWMFLSSYEKIRAKITGNSTITCLIRPEYHAFFDSAYVSICAFTLFSKPLAEYKGTFIDLNDFYGADIQSEKALEAINNTDCEWRYEASSSDFHQIDGAPIAYWLSDTVLNIFECSPRVSDVATVRQGLATSDNNLFVRNWQEVSFNGIKFGAGSKSEALDSGKKWFPFSKGGAFRRWSGNEELIVNWENDGEDIKNSIITKYPYLNGNPNFVAKNQDFYFRKGLTWSAMTSGLFSIRVMEKGSIFADKGQAMFPFSDDNFLILEGLLNSKVVINFLKVLAPTLDFNSGYIAKVPVRRAAVNVIPALNDLSRLDWDDYETSWDFTRLPLLNPDYRQPTLKATYQKLRAHWREMTLEMQQLEEENNRIFIDAYGLQDELKPEVPLNEITLTCNPYYRYGSDKSDDELESLLLADTMRELVSYAVGCMFGRYALDKPGLILANQGETIEDYLKQVPEASFPADDDNVIPILDGDWFTDDITERFRKFLRVTFGDEHYEENLRFVERALNIKGKRNYGIRDYFLGEFYTDHVKRYKKRPIYWLFSSPKGSFNALIYMHRYRPDTVSIVLNEYLREFRTKLTAEKNHQEQISISASVSASDKTKALRETQQLNKMIKELEDYEREVIYPLATQQVEIDLDDGVKVNYPKFGKALKKIPGLEAKED